MKCTIWAYYFPDISSRQLIGTVYTELNYVAWLAHGVSKGVAWLAQGLSKSALGLARILRRVQQFYNTKYTRNAE